MTPRTTALAQVDAELQGGSPDEVTVHMEYTNVIDLSMPDLKPLDNAAQVVTEKIVRRRYPVKITNCDVFTTANGFRVRIPNAGQEGMFGPDGSDHVFSGESAKADMLTFVGTVIGQVAYRYRDEVLHTAVGKSEVVEQGNMVDSMPDGPG